MVCYINRNLKIKIVKMVCYINIDIINIKSNKLFMEIVKIVHSKKI